MGGVGESFGRPKDRLCGVVRGRGYYVRRIVPEEDECDEGDIGEEVDRSGGVCYGK